MVSVERLARGDEVVTVMEGKGGRTRRRILDAAAVLLARGSDVDVTFSDIARAADLKPGSFNFHLSSRDEVIAEVLAWGSTRRTRTLNRALDAAASDPASRLSVAIGAHLSARVELSDYAAVVASIGNPSQPIYRRSIRT